MRSVAVLAHIEFSVHGPGLSLASIDWSRVGVGDAWLELLGRLHPILVHFPIALIIVAATLEAGSQARRRLTRSRRDGGEAAPALGPTARSCLLIGLAGAVGAIASGWLLASDGSAWGADRNTVEIHRWIAIASTVVAMAAFLAAFLGRARAARLTLFLSAGLVGLAGHFGGSLVHGSGHLLEPFQARPTDEALANASFEISPEAAEILGASCVECHGPTRKRGNLRLDDSASIARRGIVVPGVPDASELIRRVLLPVEDDEAMPPEGDARLSEAQVETLRAWIATASTGATDGEHPDASARMGAADAVRLAGSELAAHRDAVARLIDMGVPVAPMAEDSHAVAVHLNLIGEHASDDTLEALKGLEGSLVVLDLTGAPITDAAGRVIAGMSALEELRLARTGVGDELIRAIAGLPALRTLNLYETRATDASVRALASMPALEVVYLHGTAVSRDTADELAVLSPRLRVVIGAD